ncbi:MAG: fibronectin type III domain-containing protein [Actinobacteria bacterium]|nr:fibronectin type III domain-containing protein [Actinomycetota bacterium]
MGSSWQWGAAPLAAVTLVGATLVSTPAYAAAQTYVVTSTNCVGPGSFTEAVALANQNPGIDTIEFQTDVNLNTCGAVTFPYMAASATESLIISGNGHTVDGHQMWITSDGRVNPPGICPSDVVGTTVVAVAPGLVAAGTYDVDNTGISVQVENLNISHVSQLARAMKNSALTVRDVNASHVDDIVAGCDRAPIMADEAADVTIEGSTIAYASRPGVTTPLLGNVFGGVVENLASAPGTLVVSDSTLYSNDTGGGITWSGDTTIVNSRFEDTGGLYATNGQAKVVNSAWSASVLSGNKPESRLVAGVGSILDLTASTATWQDPVCTDPTSCGPAGLGLWADGGEIGLRSSAIGGADGAGSGPLLQLTNFGTMTSDEFTWVQPTASQDAAAIGTILPTALTAPPGLPTAVPTYWPDVVTPLLGSPSTPGVLIDAVPDAVPGGANELLNPLTGSPITKDALGNPRWDAGNGKRSIGAVQSVQSPHLVVDSTTASSVTLSWNRPTDPASGPITGYAVIYSPAAGGPEQRWNVPGAATLGATITGLTAGTEYAFQVVPVNAVGDGPRSNQVNATALGPIAAPAVTGVPGSFSVTLSWPTPDAGGHPGPLTYSVTYRKAGAQDWTQGPVGLTTLGTTITGLENLQDYVFGVVAQSPDGAVSPMGTTLVMPEPGVGADVFVPIEPTRVYDSRRAGPGGTADPIAGKDSRVMQVADGIDIATGQVIAQDIVPAGASSIAFNLTATNTQARGWFSITPGDAGTFAASTVNWPGGSDVIANGLTVKIAADRTVKVFNGSGAPTDAVLDVVGYFINPGTPGTVFHEITPTRVYDSRTVGAGGTADPIAGHGDRVISVANGTTPPTPDIVPAGATAVAYNISAVDTLSRGWFAVTPGDAVTYGASTVNWPGAGDVIDNGQFVKLDANRQIKVFNGGSTPTNVVIEVLGYFTDSIGATDGTYFHSIDPVRAYDSRAPQPDPGALPGGATRTVSVANGRDLTTGAVTVPDVIPADAASISYNITATDTTNRGWFSVTPGDVFDQTTASINWPDANNVVANGLTVKLDGQRQINVRSGSPSQTQLVVDLYGYFK